uniref:BZIP domain-containing protein n=1 Tax=Strongyloides stercoralis TaxID=6248 RepID=A0AAF5I2W5_STRER
MNYTSSLLSKPNNSQSNVNSSHTNKQQEEKINGEVKCCSCGEVLNLHESLEDSDKSKIMEYSLINNSKLSFVQGNIVTMIANSDSPFHVPICNDCHLVLVENLRSKNITLEEQNKGYKECLKKIILSESDENNDEIVGKINLKKLQEKERLLLNELKQLESEEKELEDSIKILEEKESNLICTEKKLINSLKIHHGDMVKFSLKKLSMKLQETFAIEQLNELRKVNMLNKTFYIYVNNKEVGCINDLRLGKLPDQSIPLNEFNAAWGQCVLCLHVLFELLGLKQYPYQLIPMGSQSIIREYNSTGSRDYKLYESSWKIFKTYIDDSISVYVKCLQKFDVEFCQQNNIVSGTIFPYTIRNDRIADEVVNASNEASAIWYSIKTQFQKVTENIFSKNLPILRDKLFEKSQLPFIEFNNRQPIRINALVVDNNFDPDIVFGSQKNKLYKSGFSTSNEQNSENAPSNSLQLTGSRKSSTSELDRHFRHQYDKNDQSSYRNISPFTDSDSVDEYIDEALKSEEFDLNNLSCNDKDLCDDLFSSLDEVERNDFTYQHHPTEENFLTSEFEIIAREMQNNPNDPFSTHFDPYMYDMKMAPKKLDINLNNQNKRKGQSSSESLSLFGNTKINVKRVTKKESSVPVDMPGDMSLRPELAKEKMEQFNKLYSLENETDGSDNNDGKKKAGRVSKDNELLIENNINITPGELRDFTLKQFKTFLDNNNLSEEQKALCRNIRRRGRNKIAAKKVRINRLSKTKKLDDSTFDPLSFSPTLFLNDPEPTPSRYIRKSQSQNVEFEFSDDLLEKSDPLYRIHDIKI